jgi:hypothetical protein
MAKQKQGNQTNAAPSRPLDSLDETGPAAQPPLLCPLEAFRERLAAAYPAASPRPLAFSLLSGIARYPEETARRNGELNLHVAANQDTVAWLMAVVTELCPDTE